MSKLEDALERARRDNATDSEGSDSASRGMISAGGWLTNEDLERRAEMSKQIARMDEPETYSPVDLEKRRIIYPEMADRQIANAFREIRTRLLKAGGDQNFTVLVTSVSEAGGSSFVTLNLASAFSFDESKTALLIDGNLRDPAMDRMLDLEVDKGLVDFLEDTDIGVDSIIHSSGIKRLRVIPMGSRREAATEFFTSIRMRLFLDAVKHRYPDRFVFIDSAAIGETADAKILADLADFVVVVVPYGGVTEQQVEQAIAAVAPQKLVGIIMNNEPAW